MTDFKDRGASAPEEFTEEMLEAGVLVLAGLRQPLCDDEITLREVVRRVYMAARQVRTSESIEVSALRYRRLSRAFSDAETFQKRSR